MPGLPQAIPEEAFLLMVQTPHMRKMYTDHADKVLCVDSTHGTTQYRFSLLAAVVPDGNGEGKLDQAGVNYLL